MAATHSPTRISWDIASVARSSVLSRTTLDKPSMLRTLLGNDRWAPSLAKQPGKIVFAWATHCSNDHQDRGGLSIDYAQIMDISELLCPDGVQQVIGKNFRNFNPKGRAACLGSAHRPISKYAARGYSPMN